MKRFQIGLMALIAAVVLGSGAAWSDSAEGPSAPAQAEDNREKPAAEVVDQMMKQIQKNPLIEPSERPTQPQTESNPISPTPSVEIDPRVIGIAPGMVQPKLRREGEFVVNRRGRITRSVDGRHLLFVFDSDSKAVQDPPMILVPSQILQNMEDLVLERGDKIIFTLSGQVLSYRGANYLLPTMMKLAVNRGNLQN